MPQPDEKTATGRDFDSFDNPLPRTRGLAEPDVEVMTNRAFPHPDETSLEGEILARSTTVTHELVV